MSRLGLPLDADRIGVWTFLGPFLLGIAAFRVAYCMAPSSSGVGDIGSPLHQRA